VVSLDFSPLQRSADSSRFHYSITPDAVSITDTGRGRASVTRDIEAVLRKIEYWHQGSIATFKIMYRGERGVCNGVSKTVDAQNS
jgi:hypothetical protein